MTSTPPPPPPPPSRPPLPDRWHTRDLPVLLEIARALDAGQAPDEQTITTDLGITEDELNLAWYGLRDAEYVRIVKGRPQRLGDGRMTHIVLTERGRRAVGLWPSERGPEALLELLRQAEENTTDPEERTLLRRASGAIGSVSREVMTDIVATLIKTQAGL